MRRDNVDTCKRNLMDHYKDTAELYNRIAEIYENKFMEMDLYNVTYDNFCSKIAQNESIFEIGCGPGNITRYILKKRPDLNVDAIDIAPNMIGLAKINNPNANFWVMDCREIHTVEKKYAGILCGFCLPYISREDCDKLLSDCGNLLNPTGSLYLSFVEGNYSDSGYRYDSSVIDKYHFFYHEKAWLQNALKKHGFSGIESWDIPYPAENPVQNHIVIVASKE